jgi:hypothetical protein
MIRPTTKVDVLKQMHACRQDFYAAIDRIPVEWMTEIALYDNWTPKDLIAHLGSWDHSLAERIAAWRRGETVPLFDEDMIEAMNDHFLSRYRDMPLHEVRAMEASAFAALEHQVIESSEAEIFEPGHFPGLYIPLEQMIAGDTYEHYPDHLNDLLLWMQHNGLD